MINVHSLLQHSWAQWGWKGGTLYKLFKSTNHDIILIQDTTYGKTHMMETFSKIFPRWEVCAVESNGSFGGVLFYWNPLVSEFNPFRNGRGILIQGVFK